MPAACGALAEPPAGLRERADGAFHPSPLIESLRGVDLQQRAFRPLVDKVGEPDQKIEHKRPRRRVALERCLGDLRADAMTVAEAVAKIDGDVVVCGHSYGGMAITEATFGANVRRLVYLCAFMPVEGASLVSHFPSLPPFAEPRDDGSVVFVKSIGLPLLYSGCSTEATAWAADRLVLHSVAAITTPVTEVAWRKIPSTYVVCTDDKIIPPDIQRLTARNATEVRELAAGHSPMISAPEEVADILAEVASSRMAA